MGTTEKLSLSSTHPKGGFKRSKMMAEAVRRTDENAIRQHARENAAMKMEEIIETDRETSKTDEQWQTFSSQRSNKIQKINTHASTTTMSFCGQTIPRDSKADGVHSYFSFRGNDTRTKPKFHQHESEKSAPGESSVRIDRRGKRANLPPFKLELEAQQKPMETQVLNDFVKCNGRLYVNTATYSIHLQS